MENNKSDIKLDEQQLLATRSDSKKALCLAGAGSGKTRTLVERIAYLIEEKNISGYEIIAISFTRKAAGELKSRLADRIGPQANKVWTGTIHAYALSMLQRFGEKIGLRGHSLTVYSQWEEDFLLKEVAIDLGVYKKSWNPRKKDILAVFNKYYQEGIWPKDVYDPCYPVFNSFVQRCRENNSLTYGSLLTGLRLLLPKIKEHLKYKHIFVDEVQDIDKLQWSIINYVVEVCNASLFVCGDISQSIYSFRGAVPEYLIEHQREFDIYKLESNYRSRPEIVGAGNRLIEHNEGRIPMTIKATREEGGLIETLNNADSEAIANYILNLTASASSGTIAVLSRIHVLLDKLSDLLKFHGIEYQRVGRQQQLTNSENFRRFHAFLKLLLNPYDNFSFMLIRKYLGLSRLDYAAIRVGCMEESLSHFQSWNATPRRNSDFFTIAEKTRTFCEILQTPGISWEDSSGTVSFCLDWIAANPAGTLSDYLAWLATYDIQDEITEDEGGLKLMTIHSCKGCEFDTVMVIGMNEGIMPSKQSLGDPDSIEEERRLAYVAITRAKERLLLFVRPEKKEDAAGKIHKSPKSRFLEEMK